MAEDSPVTPRRQHGHSRAYILDRLRRENRTDFIDAIEAGRISAFAAACELGWTKRPPAVAAITHQARKRRLRLQTIAGEGLSGSQAFELWLGPNPTGSFFDSPEALRAAWETHRDAIMARWGSHGRRPQGWWAFDTELEYPGYSCERSTLWRVGVLTAEERTELEHEWREEFETAQADAFTLHDGNGILTGDCARAEHYRWADIPAALIKRWEKAERRRRERRAVPLAGVAATK
jgi:hypothetical protein